MIKTLMATTAAATLLMGASASQAGAGHDRSGPDGMIQLVSGQCPPSGRECPSAPPPVDRPPFAKPGQCFAKVAIAPRVETYSEQVVVGPPRRETRVIPAVFEDFDQRVLVSPERIDRIVIPALYRTVRETVVVRPGGVHVEQVPPVFDMVRERVMVQPARSEWRRSFVGPGGFIPAGARIQPTGEVMCLVEIPAVFQTVERRVVVQPGRTVEIADPPITRVVERQVIDREERVEERRIPAVYRMERVRRIVRAERTDYIDIPAVTRTITRQREVEPGRMDWRQIDCPPAGGPGYAPPPPPGPSPGYGPPPRGEQRGIPPHRDRDGERG